MTLVPTDEGILGVISKLDDQSPEAAAMLLRLGLFESLQDQLEPLRPQMTTHIYKQMEAVNKRARAALLRTHVGKAAAGEEEPDDSEYAEGISILDAHIEKGLVGWALNLFNRQHDRDPNTGRFVPMDQGPQHADSGHLRGDAVDLTRALLDTNSPTASRLTRGLFSGPDQVKNQDGNANQWYGATQGTERQAYNRLRLTGSALRTMGEPGSAAHTVGTAASLIGNIGPEAEKVLGPGIRRTAYRYRGTERRPDEAVLLPMKQANQVIYGLSSDDANEQARTMARLTDAAQSRGKIDPVAQIASREVTSPNVPMDKKALTIRGNTAVASMLGVGSSVEEGKNLLPDLELTQISIESGEMPPSQGVIIDHRGNVVTQAVGYNGDHYLPFDLRNLGSLYGGQYVRTRATGGPTSEDIYTGLLTGARQIQVVSNSGVFTVEFDPDLRGGRRYNDKVKRMIERYESMLGAIQGGNLYEQDVPSERMRDLRRQALRGANNDDEFQTNLRILVDRERLQGRAAEEDEDTSRQQAAAWADGQVRTEARQHQQATGQNLSNQQLARLREEKIRQYQRESGEGTARRLRLDGEGYGRALKALKQEFPYYIRTATFQPLPEWLESHGLERGTEERFRRNAPADLGYVEPGQTNFRRGYENADRTTRRGFRAARKVPTGAPGRGGAPAAAGEEQEQGAQRPAQRAQQPAQQAQGAQQPQQAAPQSLQQLSRPGGKIFQQANSHARGFFTRALELEDLDHGAPGENDNTRAIDIAYKKLHGFDEAHGYEGARSAFTNWYLNEANDAERTKFDQGIHDLFGFIERTTLRDQQGEIEHAWEEFKALGDILHPFNTDVDPNNPLLTEPNPDNPKPLEFPDIPPVTASEQEFEHFIGQLGVNNPEVAREVDNFSEIDNVQRTRLVKMAINSGDQTRIANTQLAWAVAVAKEKAELLRAMLPGTDAAPLDEVSAAYRPPRRRLVFG